MANTPNNIPTLAPNDNPLDDPADESVDDDAVPEAVEFVPVDPPLFVADAETHASLATHS